MSYEVSTGIYDGPLSLLVELARHQLLDVFLVKLRDLTAQYRRWATSAETASLNELAEPLPLLGQLVAIKARRLLPVPQSLNEEENPVSLAELERRLREYEQFKTVAQVLAELHALQHDRFTRLGSRGLEELPESSEAAERSMAARPLAVGILDLMSAFARVLDQAKVPVYEVEQEAWTVEMKVEELQTLLTVKHRLGFHELFAGGKTTLELVCTFLALLELVRQRVCAAIQERHFGEIVIVRRDPGGSTVHSP